jgi:hypothetical protein
MSETKIAELQELLKHAPSSAWSMDQCGNHWRIWAAGELICEVEEEGNNEGAMRLIVAAINALPDLLAALTAAQTERAALVNSMHRLESRHLRRDGNDLQCTLCGEWSVNPRAGIKHDPLCDFAVLRAAAPPVTKQISG